MTSETTQSGGPPPTPPGYYRIDVRVFVAFLATVMAASFVAGVVLVPPLGELLNQKVVTTATDSIATTASSSASSPILNAQDAKIVRDAYLVNASERWAKSEQNEKRPELHRPAGQHLLVDIKGVEGAFLNSEERLSKAMVDTVEEAG